MGATCRMSSKRLAVVTLVAVLTMPALARAEGVWEDAGVGVGTALLNLLYIPVKITYATLGAVTGGIAYGLTVGSTQTAMAVWEPTMGGTYVLNPDMLRGEQPDERLAARERIGAGEVRVLEVGQRVEGQPRRGE